MRLLIIDDTGIQHAIHDNVELVNWFDRLEMQDLMECIRHTIATVEAGEEDDDE